MAPPSPGRDIRQRRGAAHSEELSVFPPYAFLIDNSSNFITVTSARLSSPRKGKAERRRGNLIFKLQKQIQVWKRNNLFQ